MTENIENAQHIDSIRNVECTNNQINAISLNDEDNGLEIQKESNHFNHTVGEKPKEEEENGSITIKENISSLNIPLLPDKDLEYPKDIIDVNPAEEIVPDKNSQIYENSIPPSVSALKESQTTDSICSNLNTEFRRNSLPGNPPILHNLEADRAKIAPDLKNLSGVVKNVHGLFSNLKNAYKPMEKNFGGIMSATQKNLSIAKGVYFSRHDKNEEVVENLSKYSTLNLNSENVIDNVENVFSKCPPRNSPTNMSSPEKNTQQTIPTDVEEVASKEKISDTNSDSSSIHNEPATDEEKIQLLEKTIIEQNRQLHTYQAANVEKDLLLKEIEAKINNLKTQTTAALKERDGAVMKYAVSERTGLEAIRARDLALAAEKAAKAEASLLTQRLRQEHAHRARICAMLDDKSHEVSTAQKEAGKLREELQSCEVKLKWAQNKLSTEMDSHKETSALADRLTHQISHMEGSPLPASSSPIHSAENGALLKEKEAIIIMEKHERERAEAQCKQLTAELQQLRNTLSAKNQETRDLKSKVDETSAEAESLRMACAELREQAAKDCERLAAAQARGARTDTLAAHLQQEQEKTTTLQTQLDAERAAKSEAHAEVELRARRETELLKQTERLTEASVRLQARCSEAEAKALALTVENASLRTAAENASKLVAMEREGRASDAKALAAAAARHAKAEKEARSQADAAEGEARAKDAKHAAVLKELKRDVLHWKKKCEKLESDDSQRHITLSMPSQKAGSCSSLSSFEGNLNHASTPSETSETIAENQVFQIQAPDRQQLVERIVSLQRAAARRGERVDFLEDHCAQLTHELQRKTKLLRELLAKTPAGALTSLQSDKAKAEISKHGGIMSSVYGSHVTDETMTLELSLEMNSKLQSVLEDALLKNITLKENMDTLGDEITRLKDELKATKPKK